MNKNNCVYFLYDNNGIIRYIGEGTSNRARDFSHNTRSTLFKQILSDGGSVVVKHSGLTKEEALTIENEYLKKYVDGNLPNADLINKLTSKGMIDLSYTDLSKLFALSEESKTGLIWIIERVKGNGRLCSKARVGYQAGCVPGDKNGARGSLILNGGTLLTHRIIWVLYNKKDLPWNVVINHIDGDHKNNHLSNLEAVTQKVNILKTINRKTTSEYGINAVGRVKQKNKYESVVTYYCDESGKQIHKTFSISKNGELQAIAKALAWRSNNLLNCYGYEHSRVIIDKMYQDFTNYCILQFNLVFDYDSGGIYA